MPSVIILSHIHDLLRLDRVFHGTDIHEFHTRCIHQVLGDTVLDLHDMTDRIDDPPSQFIRGFLGLDLKREDVLVTLLGDPDLIVYDGWIDEHGLVEQ